MDKWVSLLEVRRVVRRIRWGGAFPGLTGSCIIVV
jgi:hypothetical protein